MIPSLKAMVVPLFIFRRSRVHQILSREFFLAEAPIIHDYTFIIRGDILTRAVYGSDYRHLMLIFLLVLTFTCGHVVGLLILLPCFFRIFGRVFILMATGDGLYFSA
jgi:hypothetical protein